MQNYANHRKYVPAFHFFAFPLLTLNLGWQISKLKNNFSSDALVNVTTAAALLVVCFLARVFALKVQDRVIRLEMRLKLREVLPAEMHYKINQLSAKQLVGLRFASDGELPALVTQILKDNIASADSIKKMIKDWQADDLRA